MPAPDEERIEHLAALAGILPGYRDQAGRRVETGAQARRAVLNGLGFATGSKADVEDGIERLRAVREAPLARVIACLAERPTRIELRTRHRGDVAWSIVPEEGAPSEGVCGLRRSAFELPPLAPGYHRLEIKIGAARHAGLLVVSPPRCWAPSELEARRAFGVTAQTYGLRSDRQFGIGDYTDVADLGEGAARWGASFLGLSPAHALFPADPSRFSPYSPSSRLFLQTALIDPMQIAADAPAALAAIAHDPAALAELEALRSAPLIDYPGVWSLKRKLFTRLWRRFGGEAIGQLQSFRAALGQDLELHATFDALSEHFAQTGALSPDTWPAAFRDPRSPAVDRFRSENQDLVSFHIWLQWIADGQLAGAHRRARAAGMEIGLYRDLAVGPDRAGSEVWSAPGRFALDLSIGAPPDPLGPEGQDWGLPPLDPFALESLDLRPFRDLVVANMRHAGALRIDHAFQLQRLFLIPAGASAGSSGAYVAYPFEALLGVLRLESHRAKCMVIAEDLGTSPRGFSEAIMRSGIFSYRLLSFERDKRGAFAAPENYPPAALAALSTHDLPTFVGWWRGLDVDLRECFGVFDATLARAERQARAKDRRRFEDALRRESLPSGGARSDDPAPIESALRLLARTRSQLAAVQIEDVIAEEQQANLPGPSSGHPNWRRRLSLPIEAIVAPGGPLAKAGAILAREGRGMRAPALRLSAPAPRATYRLQFNARFTFDDAIRIVPYLRDLGVSHVYASPITTACPGSMHGYDVVDYQEINPELGGEAAFISFSDALREADMGLILDFVPNHMGIASRRNRWWDSALEWGEASPYASAFDIDWRRPGSNGKLLLPALGCSFAQALAAGEIELRLDAEAGAFAFAYFDKSFPLRPDLYPELLQSARSGARSAGKILEQRIEAFRALSALSGEALPVATLAAKRSLAEALAERPALTRAVAAALAFYQPGSQTSALRDLLERQHYRLSYWRLASSEVNYRRFFDISTLAGVRVEDEGVFARMHELVFRLARDQRIHGLRIDHIDGLTDPAAYLERLQNTLGPGFYVIVEKILESGERLRDWPIAGSSGYEMTAALDRLFVEADHVQDFNEAYEEAVGAEAPFEDQLYAIKMELANTSFASEVKALVDELEQLAQAQTPSLDLFRNDLRRALLVLLSCFPVYRTYMSASGPDGDDSAVLAAAEQRAKTRLDTDGARDLAFILQQLRTSDPNALHRKFTARFQQLTGPLMAKSLEDTLFYRYGRLLALNEVGGDPSQFGSSHAAFHAQMAERAQSWPAALSATATHDTKRGEDARGRLLAATAFPGIWREAFQLFAEAIAQCRQPPDARDSYLLYQSVLASLPLALLHENQSALEARRFLERAKQFATKALRETKRRTSWTEPDHTYEKGVADALEAILSPRGGFLRGVEPLAREIALRGAELGVARTVLKCALPGVPDFYQGAEFWDFSFVDPDNRQPVDYEARRAALESRATFDTLLADWPSGRVKQIVIARMLADRKERPSLYASGAYAALEIIGSDWRRPIAFERKLGSEGLIVVAATRFGRPESARGGSRQEARIPLPPGVWRNLLDDQALLVEGAPFIGEVLGRWPALALRKTH